jgi:hypothetical protein
VLLKVQRLLVVVQVMERTAAHTLPRIRRTSSERKYTPQSFNLAAYQEFRNDLRSFDVGSLLYHIASVCRRGKHRFFFDVGVSW